MRWYFRILAAFILACTASVAVAQSAASTRQGISAFQRGKYDEAVKLLQPQAEKGDADAMFVLGKIYSSGSGVEKDLKKGAGYFAQAAELGHADAQQSLGSALMLGEGVEQDMIEALKWFIISARAGNPLAGTYAGNVAKFMNRDMQREARTKALTWQQAYDKKKAAQ